MRKAYYRILVQMGALDFKPSEPTPGDGGNQLAPQRGWILEDSVAHWLNAAGGNVTTPEEALTNEHYYGHADRMCLLAGRPAVLEIKHQGLLAYLRIMQNGLLKGAPLYYAQVQGYMALAGVSRTLVAVLSSDPSAIKGRLTQGKGKSEGTLEPDFRMVEQSSGVNPFAYFEVVEANQPFQRELEQWAMKLGERVQSKETPDRTYDLERDWQCRAEWCEFLPLCQGDGTCKEPCEHKACHVGEGEQDRPVRGMIA